MAHNSAWRTWPRLATPTPRALMQTRRRTFVARHCRDQGACGDGEQADLAERPQAGAQRADDGIPAVQTEWPFVLTPC